MADAGAPLTTWGNFWRGAVDRVLPGSQRGSDGRLIGSQVGRGLAGRGATFLAGMYGGPGAGAITNRLATNWVDRGNPVNFGAGNGPLGQMFSGGGGNDIGGVVRQPLTVPGLSLNLGLPSVGNVAPTYNGAANPQPYNAWTPSSDWGAAQLAGTTDKPRSPFSPEGAYNSTNAPSAGGTSYDPTSATNQAWLFTNNMNRMNAMARDAIQKRMR